MNLPSTESKPLRERLLPQTSIRFYLLLIGASAVVMYIYRAAFLGDAFWAKIASLLITVAGGCAISYVVLFLLANLFSATASSLFHGIPSQSQVDATGNDSSAELHSVGEP